MKSFLSFVLLSSSFLLFSQGFNSGSDKKLYKRVDKAYDNYDFDTILENEEALNTSFLKSEDTLAARVSTFLAESYYEYGDFKNALNYYTKELNIREKIKPESISTDLVFNIAEINKELGNYSKAESLYKRVLKSDEREFGKKSEEYFDTAIGLAEFYIQTETPDEGLKLLNDLKKNIEKNTVFEIGVLKSIGDSYAIKGSYRNAQKYFVDAIDIAEKNGLENNIEYVSVLNSLGILYTDVGKLPEAEEEFDLAMETLKKIPGDNDDWRIGVISNMARLYFDYGEYDRAETMQVEVANDDKEYFGAESFNYGTSLLNLGRTYIYNKKYVEAEEKLLEGRSVLELSVGKEGIDYARAESLLSLLYQQKGKNQKAIEFANRAYDAYLLSIGKNHYEIAYPLYNLANSYMSLGKLDIAEEKAKEALTIRKRKLGKTHPLYAKSTNQMAILEWKRGNKTGAINYYRETFDNFFGQINAFFPVLTEEEKAKFYYANVKPAFEQYISFVLHIEDDSELKSELLEELYDYQLSLKGLILYATQRVKNSIYSSGDQELIAKYDEWINEKEQLAKLFSANDPDLDIVKRNKKIDSLTVRSNKLEEELAIASKTFGESFANKDIKWSDVKEQLKPGEAAIEMIRYKNFVPDSAGYFTEEVDYTALIIRADKEGGPTAVNIDKGRTMESKYLANYRNAIRYRIKENYSYKLFWEPIAQALKGIKKVYFSPDGVYNQVSIYTFRNPDTNEYLVEEFDLQVVTNTKDLIVGEKGEDNLQGVFFGYPNYNMGALDEIAVAEGGEVRGLRGLNGGERGVGNRGGTRGGTRGARGTRSVTRGSLRGKVVPRGIRGNLVRYMRAFNEMALLPGTLREVQNIDSLYQKEGLDAITYYANDAVEKQIKEVKSPSTLHIATHGFFLELDPDDITADTYVQNPLLRSGLVLAGANSFILTGEMADSDNDGILTAYEAMNLDLSNTDVVVLSACETGLGEIRNGEGVYGLQRAFKIAGADAIIMSMWSVDDDATQQLMNNFYEEWVSGATKGDAFIAAQKRLKEKYPDPFFWGAFVLVGN